MASSSSSSRVGRASAGSSGSVVPWRRGGQGCQRRSGLIRGGRGAVPVGMGHGARRMGRKTNHRTHGTRTFGCWRSDCLRRWPAAALWPEGWRGCWNSGTKLYQESSYIFWFLVPGRPGVGPLWAVGCSRAAVGRTGEGVVDRLQSPRSESGVQHQLHRLGGQWGITHTVDRARTAPPKSRLSPEWDAKHFPQKRERERALQSFPSSPLSTTG